ncbi:hypothetical protein MKL33_09855, partial [Acinetobacter sp. AOR43_HL]|nr:hypothetical protein [Acinetobacter sp. AOR43_HL]
GSSVTTIVTSSSVSANSDLSNVTANDIVSINGNTTLTLAQKQVFLDYVQGWSKSNISSGIASSAVGVINNATGVGSSAVGFNNTASATNSSVFGSYSKATHTGATALGNDSETDRDNSISVGKAGAEKQITNVKAGTADTDAINKKQLDSEVLTLNTRIDNLPTGGSTPIASDNYAHTSTDTALGSAKGSAHATTTTPGKITAVGGITVTTTGAGTSLDDIDSFTANGVAITKAANPTAVAAFINAAKKGGNIAVGSYSSAVGTANIASGSYSSAVGYVNTASSHYSSAVGYLNTASGQSSSAVGYVNTASGSASSAVGYNNKASGGFSSSMGHINEALGSGSSAVGTLNFAKGQYSTAMGMENYTQNQSSAAVGTRKIPNQALTPFVTGGVITSVNGINVTGTGSSLNDITHINGTAVNATELNAFLEHLIWGGNLALADESSVFGVGGITTGNRSTAIGFDSLADEANTVSVGRAGAEKRITNVATPTKATDAA